MVLRYSPILGALVVSLSLHAAEAGAQSASANSIFCRPTPQGVLGDTQNSANYGEVVGLVREASSTQPARIAIASPRGTNLTGGALNAGRIYLHDIDRTSGCTAPVQTIAGNAGDKLGSALARLPVGGTNYLLAGASNPASGAPRVMVYTEAGTLVGTGIQGPTVNPPSFFGDAITTGDLTGDGVPEVIIGAPGTDELYVYNGAGAATGAFTQVAGSPFSVNSHQQIANIGNEKYGQGLAIVGDVNGDGRDDLAVGAPFGGSTQGGCVGIVGWDSSLAQLVALNKDICVPLDPTFNISTQFGRKLARIGDIDADSTPDVAVAAPFYSEGVDANVGRVYLLSLQAASAAPVLLSENIRESRTGSFFGDSLSSAETFPQTGIYTVTAGAYGFGYPSTAGSGAFPQVGRSYTFNLLPAAVEPWTYLGHYGQGGGSNDRFGQSVMLIPSVNNDLVNGGDLLPDLLAGQPRTQTTTTPGSGFVFTGASFNPGRPTGMVRPLGSTSYCGPQTISGIGLTIASPTATSQQPAINSTVRLRVDGIPYGPTTKTVAVFWGQRLSQPVEIPGSGSGSHPPCFLETSLTASMQGTFPAFSGQPNPTGHIDFNIAVPDIEWLTNWEDIFTAVAAVVDNTPTVTNADIGISPQLRITFGHD